VHFKNDYFANHKGRILKHYLVVGDNLLSEIVLCEIALCEIALCEIADGEIALSEISYIHSILRSNNQNWYIPDRPKL
jgi:hypothetical protein